MTDSTCKCIGRGIPISANAHNTGDKDPATMPP